MLSCFALQEKFGQNKKKALWTFFMSYLQIRMLSDCSKLLHCVSAKDNLAMFL